MSEVVISVRGTHSVEVAPERGTVFAEVSFDGPEAQPVMQRLRVSLDAARGELERLQEQGAVERLSVQRIRTSAQRPWSQDGAQLPLVHTATASLSAEFSDLDALATWIGWSAGVDGLAVGHVGWSLTKDRQREIERVTRQEAVRQAQLRAQDYADALELGRVTVRSISDPGVAAPPHVREAKFAAASAGDAGLGLDPEDLTIAAEVEATFTLS